MSDAEKIREIEAGQLKTILQEEKLPVMIIFQAKWLASASMFCDIASRAVVDFAGKIICYKINTDRREDLLLEYGIQTLPMTLIFRRGEVIDHFAGVMNINKLRRKLEKAVQSFPTD